MSESDKTALDPGATMPDPGATAPDKDKAFDLTAFDPGLTETGPEGVLTAADAASPSASPLAFTPYAPGDLVLGIYRVESNAIESGGMGRVWRVNHAGWNCDLAMKRPRAEFFLSEKHKADFVRECEEWIRLGLHPNIVSCYYVREIDGIPSIFSEWMNGGSLAESIESGSLYAGDDGEAVRRILDVAIQFARGLRYAHGRKDADGREIGLIHQDVKPGNVLLSKDGEAKVSDFGLARAHALSDGETVTPGADAPADSTKTKYAGSGGYTPAYCSMEQMDGQKLTRRTDIYSWAASVMEMWLGSRPWSNGVVAGLKCSEYFNMARLPIPEAMRELLTRCLASEADDRPHDFGVVEEKLLEIFAAETGGPYSRPPSVPARDTASSLNNRALSFLDLGKPGDAEKCWNQALAILPDHGESIYNHAVFQWTLAKIDDLEAVRRLTIKDINSDHYLSLVHLARGDVENAEECLARGRNVLGETDALTKLSDLIKKVQNEKKDARCIEKFDFAPRNDTDRLFDKITSIDCSRDGSKALVLSRGRLTYLDLVNKNCVWQATTSGGQGSPNSSNKLSSISPDGKHALLADAGDQIKIFDLSSGECLRTIKASKTYINAVCHCPDPDMALFGGNLGDIFLWDLKTGDRVRTLTCPDGKSVYSICVSPDGEMAASGGEDGAVNLFRLDTGSFVGSFTGHSGNVNSVAFGFDGKTLITGGSDKGIKLWDLNTLECVRTFTENSGKINSISLSLDGKKALSGGGRHDRGVAKLWDTSTGRCLRSFDDHATEVASVYLFPDGSHGLVGGSTVETSLKVWRMPDTGPPNYILSKIHPTNIAIGQKQLFDSKITEIHDLMAGDDIPGALKKLSEVSEIKQYGDFQTYYDTKRKLARFCARGRPTAVEVSRIRCDSTGSALTFDSTGDRIFGDNSRLSEIHLWDIKTGELVRQFSGHDGWTTSICLSRDKKILLSGCIDRTMKIWDVETGKSIGSYTQPQMPKIYGVYFSPDGRDIVSISGAMDGIQLWDVKTRKCVATIRKDQELWVDDDLNVMLNGVRYSDNGKEIIVAYRAAYRTGKFSYNGKIFNLSDAKEHKFLRPFLSGKSSFFFTNREGADLNVILAVYNVKSRKKIDVIHAAVKECRHGCYSPDGKLVATSFDNTLEILDADSGKCLQRIALTSHIGVNSSDVCFSFDGTKIASTCGNEIIVYELDYDLAFPGWADWDDGALPCVEAFLSEHPNHTEADFEDLLVELGGRGYGWLRPEGVRGRLETLDKNKKKGFFSSLFGKKN
ncbi:MAG: protein kinase [Deltaproteobacteria bacterium]|jgi:WD40 repeat protein/serine/threonine protein kinase|nr:protein kinase [Deltaproteobacteria bacterium]